MSAPCGGGEVVAAGEDQASASLAILDASQAEAFPYDIQALGLTIRVHANVFSPKYFHGWEIFTRHFPNVTGQRVLEIGCGTGVTSVYLALRGAAHVTAVDINPAAVFNARENARLNHVAHLDIRESDVFSDLRVDERFETIYWNFPFLYQPAEYAFGSILERALFDPGYQLLERFLGEAKSWIGPSGRLVVGMGDFALLERFEGLCQQYGWKIRLIAKESSVEGNPVEFQLYELVQ